MYNHASSSGDVHPKCLGGGIGIHNRLKICRLMAMRVQVPPKAPLFVIIKQLVSIIIIELPELCASLFLKSRRIVDR